MPALRSDHRQYTTITRSHPAQTPKHKHSPNLPPPPDAPELLSCCNRLIEGHVKYPARCTEDFAWSPQFEDSKLLHDNLELLLGSMGYMDTASAYAKGSQASLGCLLGRRTCSSRCSHKASMGETGIPDPLANRSKVGGVAGNPRTAFLLIRFVAPPEALIHAQASLPPQASVRAVSRHGRLEDQPADTCRLLGPEREWKSGSTLTHPAYQSRSCPMDSSPRALPAHGPSQGCLAAGITLFHGVIRRETKFA